jgi:periplasmic divalent cation tolerance protein
VLTTCPIDKSQKLIEEILKSKLAGCVLDVLLAKSKFWWKGEIEEEKETLIVFKTRDELVEKLFKKIKELHPYEIPFICEIEVKKVNEEYLKWLKEVTE